MKTLLFTKSPESIILVLLILFLIHQIFNLNLYYLIISFIIILIGLIYFYRIPQVPCNLDKNALLAPSYGTVTNIYYDDKHDHTVISSFLSPLDPHIQYIPTDSIITNLNYKPGEFNPANFFHKSKYNESCTISLKPINNKNNKNNTKPILIRQIAGQLARRIENWKLINQSVKQGEIYGIIKFGSRVDISIPGNVIDKLLIKKGDYLEGCRTKLLIY